MKSQPCINRETGKPFDWENPNFTPGIHCTSCRFAVLTEPRNPDFRYTCSDCIVNKKLYTWKRRSEAAFRGAAKRKLNREKK